MKKVLKIIGIILLVIIGIILDIALIATLPPVGLPVNIGLVVFVFVLITRKISRYAAKSQP